MATFKAFIIIALVFGVWAVGPFLIMVIGTGAGIWAIRALIIWEKEHDRSSENREGSDYRGFVGAEPFIDSGECLPDNNSQESDGRE